MPHPTFLRRAADLIQTSGLGANGWGTEGGPICMGTALALAMGADPARLGRFGFHSQRSNEVVEAVGGLILGSGLLQRSAVAGWIGMVEAGADG